MRAAEIRLPFADAVRPARYLSPFRYPGGKSWLVPEIKAWLRTAGAGTLVEPFAGGATATLTALSDNLVDRAVMAEVDGDVSAVWAVLFGESDADFARLAAEIQGFAVTRESVTDRLAGDASDVVDLAFRTVLRNRVNRGGVMAPGAMMLKRGEKDRGVASRWYPGTLVARMAYARSLRARVTFVEGDAFGVIARMSGDPSCAFFVDPPYTAGGKRVGAGLYRHSRVDHASLFSECASVAGAVMMTYDDVPEVVALAEAHALDVSRVPMRNAHHDEKSEVVIRKPARALAVAAE